MEEAQTANEDKLKELVDRIVVAAKPRRVILFGSAARGEMGPDSDLDVLVVVPDGVHRGHATEDIYRGLWGFGIAKDVVVVTESDLEIHGSDPYKVIGEALERGRELYRAAG